MWIWAPSGGAIEIMACKDMPREADTLASGDESYC
jgi:hypothetical protein